MSTKLLIPILLLFMALPTLAQGNPVSKKIQDLVKLRAQVDSLSHDLAKLRTQSQDTERAAAAQISHLELQIRQASIRNSTLLKKRKRFLEKIEEQQEKRDALTAPLQATIEILRKHVQRGLPYQIARRNQALDKIEKELFGGTPKPATSLAKLLQFIDDEETLTREIGIGQQVITIGGGEVLVEVVHIGMAALYFVTNDERYGLATLSQEKYSFQLFNDPQESASISNLFENIRSGQRTGFVHLALDHSQLKRGN